MEIYYIIASIFVIFLIICTPLFMQRNAHQTIDESKFKLIKLSYFSYFFRGFDGQSTSKHGLILPMLIIQIQGYFIGLISSSIFVVNLCINFIEKDILLLILCSIYFVHIFFCIIIIVLTGKFSKKNK